MALNTPYLGCAQVYEKTMKFLYSSGFFVDVDCTFEMRVQMLFSVPAANNCAAVFLNIDRFTDRQAHREILLTRQNLQADSRSKRIDSEGLRY